MNYVKNNIKAGNVYVNRNIVGAVVGVQPFGGQGKSGTGPKAGGPYYMHRLANEKLSGVRAVEEIYNPEKVAEDKKQTSKLIKDKYINLKAANGKTIGKKYIASVNTEDTTIEIASKEAELWSHDAHIQIDKTIQQVAYYCLQAKKEFAHPQLLPVDLQARLMS